MANLFYADWYRVRKSAAFRNTIIALVGMVAFLACSFQFMTSDGWVVVMDQETIPAIEREELRTDLEQLEMVSPQNAVEFSQEIMATNILLLLLLPIFISVFAADFTAKTFRNTLSYESNRPKVYFAKLGVSVLCCLLLTGVILLTSLVIGGISFGFSGFTAGYFSHMLVFILLMFPIQLGSIGFGHCVVAFTRKSSAAIGTYMTIVIVLAMILQLAIAMHYPALRWLSLLEWNGVGNQLMDYPNMAVSEIVLATMGGLGAAAVTTILGVVRFKKTDIA